jgi:hypothetical protein
MTPDVLEQRLADLAIDTPDPGRINALVMSRAARPQRRYVARAVAIGVATIAFMGAVLYFVPAVDVVLADAPIARELLRDAGLLGAGNRVTSVGAVSTSSGYRLELVGAYADSTRTVLLVHAEPPIVLASIGMPTLTDQFGRSYFVHSVKSNALTGNLVLESEPLGWPDAITGARITLHITSVAAIPCIGLPSVDPADIKCNPGPPVAGSWTLPATLGVDEGTSLPVPAPAQLGPARFRFTSVRSSAATIAVDFEVTGVTGEELSRRIPDGKKGTAVFTLELLGPNGEIAGGGAGWRSSSNDPALHMYLLGYRFAPGEYHLHATYVGYGEFDRVIRVP